MNKELFASMRSQMVPSEKVRAELKEKLAAPAKKPVPYKRYAALAACAACAALVIAAVVPVYRNPELWMLVTQDFQRSAVIETLEPHSYVLSDGLSTGTTTITEANIDSGGGDRDQKMTREELAVNTGDLPGGAYVSDIPSQEVAVMAYQNLRTQFEKDYGPETYPEWYGGAYINDHGTLIVNIVEDYEPEDEALFLKIQDWAGSDQVGFGSAKYGLGYLRDLQDRAFDAMHERGLAVGCGVNEETGQVELDLSDITNDALQLLAELDPADDAILVRVGQAAVAQAEEALTVIPGGRTEGYVNIPAPAENDAEPGNLPADTEEAVSAEYID